MEQLMPIIWSAVGIIVTGLVTWLITVITNFFNSKIKDSKLNKWANALNEIVVDAVLCITQTFVDALKKNGNFDKEHQEEAKQKAYNIIINQLTPELTSYIQDNFGDMKDYLMNKIEAIVHQTK